jgi:hypothetical protein
VVFIFDRNAVLFVRELVCFLIAYFLATCSGIVKGLNDFFRKKAFALAQWRK